MHALPASWMTNHPVKMLEPGTIALITPPDGSLSAVLQKGMHIPEAEELERHVASRVDRYSQQSEMEVTLDSVVFADGEVIGPDRMGNLAKMNSWAAAEAGIESEVLARQGDDIAHYLESVPDSAEHRPDPGVLTGRA